MAPADGLRATARRVAAAPRAIMAAATDRVEAIALDELTADARGGVMRNGSGRRRRPRVLDTTVVPGARGPQVVTARVIGTPPGMWALLNAGRRRPARIGAGPGRRRGHRVRLRMGEGGWVTGPVEAGPTAGHGTWRRTVARANDEVPDVARRVVHGAVTNGR